MLDRHGRRARSLWPYVWVVRYSESGPDHLAKRPELIEYSARVRRLVRPCVVNSRMPHIHPDT